jgi:probable HAF family extracellular repeat protein
VNVRVIIAAAALCALFLRPAAAQTRTAYEVVDLGTLGGGQSEATAINDMGQVVGYSQVEDGKHHAFLWSGGAMTDLGTLGGKESFAEAINIEGEVVGYALTEADVWHAFLWSRGHMVDLGTLGGNCSHAVAINAAGQVAGTADTKGGRPHAFLWWHGTMTDLGALSGRTGSCAWGLSASGDVAGDAETPKGAVHHFLWHDGSMNDLGDDGGADSRYARWMKAAESKLETFHWSGIDPRVFERIPRGINASGVVCGTEFFEHPAFGSGRHAAIWGPVGENR